ncbi:MAG TPA: hypothetical protein PK078_07650 [Anaerolineales bacterium]|nr:hypothetical protein [Anaerolineales bacterium]HNA89298.1 hypothetical protein [Anaerolineales bacterium]HNB36107.1 hypothetical protein [Anaerolineales bacterium]HNC07606.1 hypothetical protein [Anaerolineales bacterium]
MSDFSPTLQNQLESIQSQLGMSLEDAARLVKRTGLTRENDIRWMFQREYRIKHEDAKMLVTVLFKAHLQVAL